MLKLDDAVEQEFMAQVKEGVAQHSVYYQAQLIFGHLLHSKLQYYVPEVSTRAMCQLISIDWL